MNGVHDMGGSHGFGPVVREANEPTFHAEWERRVFALTMAAGRPGKWNIDMGRLRTREPAARGLPEQELFRNLACRAGDATCRAWLSVGGRDRCGPCLGRAKKVDGVLQQDDVEAVLHRGRPTERPSRQPTRFRIGDRVREKNIHPTTHTRLPRYVRGRPGTIESLHGCHLFPDINALGQGESPQWLYTVRFNARDLWGVDADPNLNVSVDAWELYLESAEQLP